MAEFRCPKCDKVSSTKAGIISHARIVHKEKVEVQELTTELLRESAQGIEVESLDSVAVIGKVKEPSLGDPNYDPFAKFKTDPEHFYYRAINVRPHNLRMREAQGFKTIPGSEYGDLVLAQMPKVRKEDLDKKEEKKIKHMLTAPTQEFKQKAEEAGVETFEELPTGKD